MPQQPAQGGSYKKVRESNTGGEVHHIPSCAALRDVGVLDRDNGPSIWMNKDDHRKTKSCGRSKEANDYRATQKELIRQGKFNEAQQMDIDDLRSQFGDKYDLGIQEAKDYTQELGDRTVPTDIKKPTESPQPIPKEVTPEERSALIETYGKPTTEQADNWEKDPIEHLHDR